MTITLRERREEDLPALLDALREQQPLTGYPQTGFEVKEDFIVRYFELVCLVAEVDGRPVGHVSIQEAGEVHHDATGRTLAAWERGHGRPASELGVISALFIDNSVRGQGVGTLLLDTAAQWCRDHGLGPCLDIVPNRSGALDMYRARGWVTVDEVETWWMQPGSPLVHVMVLPEDAEIRRADPAPPAAGPAR